MNYLARAIKVERPLVALLVPTKLVDQRQVAPQFTVALREVSLSMEIAYLFCTDLLHL
jgi:hypothetical protein